MTTTRTRAAVTAMLAAALVLAFSAVAIAAGGSSLSIKTQHKATLGSPFNYQVNGHAAKGANRLQTFLNTGKKCSKTLKGERSGPFGATGASPLKVRPGGFRASYQVTPHSTGKHYICAYLYNGKSLKTDARASAVYVTH